MGTAIDCIDGGERWAILAMYGLLDVIGDTLVNEVKGDERFLSWIA
jgi:hypothetical protein